MATGVSDEADHHPLAEPTATTWRQLGYRPDIELHGGHQSRVFRVHGPEGPLVVKLVRATNPESFSRRMDFLARLAAVHPGAVGPAATDDGPVAMVDGWSAVVFPYVVGRPPDLATARDVEAMADALGALHAAMDDIASGGLPMATTLAATASDAPEHGRIIHGDFGPSNLVVTEHGLRVLDFDDCGCGSADFELGNTLYMARFDTWNGGDDAGYHRFRSRFVDAYRRAAPTAVSDDEIDRAISRRADALRHWLDHPAEAPIGIGAASPAWLARLREFLAEIDGDSG